MLEVKPSAGSPVAALIGDLVGSRTAPDRSAVHRRLTAQLNARPAPRGQVVSPPEVTAGDEFQGVYRTVGAALHAAFTLRLALLPDIDVRFGVGWGAVTMLDPARGTQDGPAWWAARDAIENVHATAGGGLRHMRTAYRLAADTPGPDPDPVNAALLCRDHMVGSLSVRSLRILGGLVAGTSKTDLAAVEAISVSAVSQRARRDGLDVIVAAGQLLERVA